MLIFVIGNIINFIAFSFAAQSLLAALEPSFVSNVIFGYILLHEPITRRIILGTSLILVGIIIIVFYSSHVSRDYTSHELMLLYANGAYLAYLVMGICFCIGGTFMLKHVTEKLKDSHYVKHSKCQRLLYISPSLLFALISGIIGTQSVLFAKSLSNVLMLSFIGQNQLTNWFSYVILIGWLSSMIFWLKRMNFALRKFPGNTIIPVFQVVWILFGVVSGGIYYQEFQDFTAVTAVMFVLGLCFVLFGVSQLAPPSAQNLESRRRSSVNLETPPTLGAAGAVEGGYDMGFPSFPTELMDDPNWKRKSIDMVLRETSFEGDLDLVSVPVVNQLNVIVN